jgi:hypothetical protein
MNKDILGFVQRELPEQLNTERTGTAMLEEYGYQVRVKGKVFPFTGLGGP